MKIYQICLPQMISLWKNQLRQNNEEIMCLCYKGIRSRHEPVDSETGVMTSFREFKIKSKTL